MIRDEELNRLIRYAQGMGLSVRFKPYVPHSNTAAEWTTDGTEVTIYVSKRDSKLDKILSLIHELGHHKSFIKNGRKLDPKVEEAIDAEEDKKAYRKRIFNYEVEDSCYWDEIYQNTNCQFDINKLHKQRELDLWTYEVYYETGKFPTKKEKAAKRRKLKEKYKC